MDFCSPLCFGGQNLINIGVWNKAAISKVYWALANKEDRLWIRWIHAYYIKGQQIETMRISDQACWMIKKIIAARNHLNHFQYNESCKQNLTKQVYIHLLTPEPRVAWKNMMYKNIARPRAKFTLWLALQNKLMTIDRLIKWGKQVSTTCCLCNLQNEDRDHLVASCSYSKHIWERMLQWIQVKPMKTVPWEQHIEEVLIRAKGKTQAALATYFAEALDHKIHPQDMVESSYSTNKLLLTSFYECCPLLKIAHFTANQCILEAFADSKRVHVIDFSLNQGLQWPPLLQALALRPGGPPAFRLSAIAGHPQLDYSTDPLQEVGWKLAEIAQSLGVEFEFRGFMADTLADLKASMLNIRPGDVEAVAVNSVFELHRLFSTPGAIEKVLDLIKQIHPKIVTIAEQEANHNGSAFMNRIKEAWHYYSTMFDVLENSATHLNTPDVLMTEQYLGGEINNLVACEGTKRVVRHETLDQWRVRFNSAGFNLVPLTSNNYRRADMLLALFSNKEGYRVEEKDGCLMLSCHSRPLITISAWRLCRQV